MAATAAPVQLPRSCGWSCPVPRRRQARVRCRLTGLVLYSVTLNHWALSAAVASKGDTRAQVRWPSQHARFQLKRERDSARRHLIFRAYTDRRPGHACAEPRPRTDVMDFHASGHKKCEDTIPAQVTRRQGPPGTANQTHVPDLFRGGPTRIPAIAPHTHARPVQSLRART